MPSIGQLHEENKKSRCKAFIAGCEIPQIEGKEWLQLSLQSLTSKFRLSPATKGVRCLYTGIFLIFSIGIPRNTAVSQEIHPSGGIDFGWQQTLLKDSCLFWGGDATSGDYFRGLRRKDSALGPIFRKGRTILKYYPEQLHVVIRVAQYKCNARGVPSLSTQPIRDDFAASLRFRAEWKDGTHAEPATEFVPLLIHHKTKEFTLTDEQILSDVLEYSFSLRCHEIPLTNHLIVIITDLEGTLFVRLSAFP